MKTETLISGSHKLNEVIYAEKGGAWYFNFDDELSIRLECFWRLFSEDGIVWTSNDHNQKYGRKTPIDLQKEINKALKEQKINKVDRIEKSGDIKINFVNGLYLEAYTDSCGYESWEINWNDKIYVGMGQGEITRFE
jgi:hypothetical protein